MKNLTTRKIVFGILMAIVLAFSVQGTADATSTTIREQSSSDKTKARSIRETFTISGTVSLNDTSALESVTITLTGDGITLTTPYEIDTTTTLSEADHDADGPRTAEDGRFFTAADDGLSPAASFSNVSGYFTTPGEKTIIIADTTAGWSRTYTYYVWRRTSESRTSTISSLSNAVVETREDRLLSVTLTGANSTFARVEFEVFKGPGTLYEDKDENNQPDKSLTKQLTAFTNNHGTASEASVYLRPNNGTSHVRAWVSGNPPGTTTRSTEAIYIYKWSVLKKVSGDSPVQTAPAASRLENPFVVQLFDSTERTKIPGATITFAPLDSGTLAKDPNFPSDLYLPDFSTTGNVKTDSEGKANVFLLLPTNPTDEAPQGATVTFSTADSVTFNASVSSGNRTPQTIEIMSGTDGQKANQYGVLEKALTVIVRDQYGDRLRGTTVEFEARDGGTLSEPMETDPGTASTAETADASDRRRDIITDSSGEASVRYLAAEGSGAQKVTATLEAGSRRLKTFTINGAPSSGGGGEDDTRDPPPTITRTLDIDVSGSGSTREVTVTALQNGVSQTGISVNLTVSGAASLSRTSGGTPLESTLTLPTTAGTYILRASTTASGYSAVTEDVTITSPGTLSLQEVGARAANGGQSIRVTVREADGTLASGTVRVTLSGAVSRIVDATNGTGAASLTLPTTGGPHTVTLSATGYTTSQHTFSTPGQTTTPGTTTPTPTGPAGAADSIEIDGSRQLSRNVNQATPLRVRVVDTNDRGVSDVRVTFRILAPGQGRLSQRGNGRAVAVETDRNGYASASLTPLGGDVIVEAKAAGVSASVTFIIDVSGAPATSTSPTPREPSTAPTPRTTISPVVHVGAANRPPMLWVDGGAIYALVGADVQRFAPSVDNAQNLAVGGGKVYWTEMTGESGGTINSANLNGSNVKELASIFATPMGIAVDTAGSKLYWTNAAGRIQSANLDGTGIKNVLQNLPGPKDITISRGNLYWTQYDATAGAGSVGIANTTGRGTPKSISTGSDTPGSLAIANGNVYWTEMTGDSGGTVNSANLNGSGATQLASILAAPIGIAVDTARSKLYWTNDRGRIQSANLDGSRIQNVVDGLGAPGDMVLSNSITAPAATTTTTTTTADNSKYDVNGDGKVDNTDASLVAGAMNTSNARYDVNGDGTVNFLDLLLVFDNRDANAAGAPTVLSMQLSAVQRDVLQEQINLLIATGDRSPAAMRTLIYLQQLIATARPEQTQLLANYPNPFNPETWIPYELATDTEVRLTIYNTHGVVIRTLQLGHQSAGYYVGRDRAAYWDGRNAYGEQVASGIYFYQLETDDLSTLRKMVILK